MSPVTLGSVRSSGANRSSSGSGRPYPSVIASAFAFVFIAACGSEVPR